jgi:uracil DNA glycosylase
MEIKMETSWKNALSDLFDKPYFSQIADHLKAEKALKTPRPNKCFSNRCSVEVFPH